MNTPFVHLHVHSCYSMMWGVSSVETLCQKASEAGFTHLALTDTNGFYGLIRFLEAAKRYGLHPIVGAYLQNKTESAVLIAKTPKGYELLSDLLTRRHLNQDFYLPREVPPAPEDLALLSSKPEILKACRTRLECWVEVIPGTAGRQALELSRTLGIPPVASNAVYFAHPNDYSLHKLVRAIALNRTLSTLPSEEFVQPDRWLKSAAEMVHHFPHCPEAMANTVKLAGNCYTAWDHFQTVFPHYEDKQEDHFAILLEACRKGIRWRYGKSDKIIEERLEEELTLIQAKGYVDYFLVVAEIVRRRPIHCGRGSGAASLASYLLGITHVDPIQHRLMFGRFLNPERKDFPDIDIDFPWDERDGIYEELSHCYGPHRLAAVANHVGFGGRAAIREVAKVFGIPAAQINEVTRRLSFWTNPEEIPDYIATHPRFHGFSLDPPWPEIIGLATRLQSLPRYISTHCGGIILTPDRVSRYVPLERNPKGIHIVQWEKEQTENAGLVKIDLLGNRSLAVIRDTIAAIERNTGRIVDYATLNPLDDPTTRNLLKRGETMGVFYVESPAMRQLQKKTRRGDFEHLVIHSSIIRPAANRYIQEYIRRLHGATYEPIHPSLKDILTETYGILVYQEDVVRVAMRLAGFSWAEADGLRKVLSKKSPEKLSHYRNRFVEGCTKKGIDDSVANTVWDMFTSFSGYSFCKPHSASYALVSFKSAYLKAHYPAEFMAAVLSNGGGYYSTLAYISEARRIGLNVLGPDINQSQWHHLGEGRTIRAGFQLLKNIRQDVLNTILEEREKNGHFASIVEFLRRVSITSADACVLVKSGALDSIALKQAQANQATNPQSNPSLNRPQLLWLVQSLLNGSAHPTGKNKQRSMNFIERSFSLPVIPPLPDYPPNKKLQQELETLGLVLSSHPLTLWEPSIRKLPHRHIPASQMDRHVGEKIWVLGWPITSKEVFTRGGDPMEFVSFEDRTAIYETVFFPKAYRRFCQYLNKERPYLLCGRVESEFGAVSLNIMNFIPIRE